MSGRDEAIGRALRRVIDPEMSLDIVELGLVYGISDDGRGVEIRVTMTSAACPVSEYILEEIEREVKLELGEGVQVRAELVWHPPWGPERLGPRARSVLDWA